MDTHKDDNHSSQTPPGSINGVGASPDVTPSSSTPNPPVPPASSTPMPLSTSPSSDTQEKEKDAPVTPPSAASSSTPPANKGMSLALIIIFLVVSFLGGLLIAGWYFQTQLQKFTSNAPAVKVESSANTKTADKPQTLIIATDATAPPMESLNEQGGLIGYDIDLGYRITNEMGLTAEFKNIPWDNIFTDLENGNIDMIISSVTINDERKQKYAFSEPYINAGQVIVSRKDNPITSTAQLKGKKISVQKGTTCETEAFKYTDPKLVISYNEFIEAANAVSNGVTDATICDLTLAKGYIDQYENLKITSDPFTNEYYGVVIRKDNTELLKKVNEALAVLRVKGILTDLKQKWLE